MRRATAGHRLRAARLFLALLVLCVLAGTASGWAQDAARLEPGASAITAEGRDRGRPRPLDITLTLTRPVPFRVFLVGDPARLIVDFKGLDLSDVTPGMIFGHDNVPGLRFGRFQHGWSRMVAELPGSYRVARASQRTRALQPVISIRLDPVADADFAPRPSATAALRDLPDPSLPEAAPAPDARLRIMLDPGHGGFDPGAHAGPLTEAGLVLSFARELAPALSARGIDVLMTRDDDRFLSLESRTTAARAAGADLFVSLHADALPAGQAAGATVYLWNPASNDLAARLLAERHDRDDLLAGVDLTGSDDALAGAMMDFARTDTHARSENFARFLTSRMALNGIGLHGRPVQSAAFSVLKAPDIPSVLFELGFLSDPVDRANLTDPGWRGRMVRAFAEAVEGWAADEVRRRGQLRR